MAGCLKLLLAESVKSFSFLGLCFEWPFFVCHVSLFDSFIDVF